MQIYTAILVYILINGITLEMNLSFFSFSFFFLPFIKAGLNAHHISDAQE